MIITDISIENWNLIDKSVLERISLISVNRVFSYIDMKFVKSYLSILFTNDQEICKLNFKWRNIKKATNVLAFPASQIKVGNYPGPILGDIVLSKETIKKEANIQKKSLNAYVSYLIIHGILHLLGYDHQNDHDMKVMKKLENKIFRTIIFSESCYIRSRYN